MHCDKLAIWLQNLFCFDTEHYDRHSACNNATPSKLQRFYWRLLDENEISVKMVTLSIQL